MNPTQSFVLASVVALVPTSVAISGEPVTSLVGIGSMPGGGPGQITATNATGSVVVGSAASISGIQGFVWTEETGVIGVGDLPGGDFYSVVTDVSDTGFVFCGESNDETGRRAFRLTLEDGMTALGEGHGTGGIDVLNVVAISDDGSIIWGNGDSPSQLLTPFRWTESTGTLEFPFPLLEGYVKDADGDGTRAVGFDYFYNTAWGSSGVGTFFHDHGEPNESSAEGVSADGEFIVGSWEPQRNSNDANAFSWQEGVGNVDLGRLPGHRFAVARAVSADGGVIVGMSRGNSVTTEKAMIWTPEDGMHSLAYVLINNYGLDLGGWQLKDAVDVSHDGRVIVGNGINPDGENEGFIVTLGSQVARCPGDCDESGTIDFGDLIAMLFEFGESDALACDTDASGVVDFHDLVAALFLFGPCDS
ncbi:unnamed protein product [Symbiodinium necroappetens]|uniref:EF-hand domain-containing protein n=1 Tax=Symbiodinium necroappetens TaxID=1628268 RepID=A0A812VM34_9DINO|nr:unnamed protein product [Symbiodinium necroappetens]